MSEKNEDIRKELNKELYLRNAIEVEGIKFDPSIFKNVLEENEWLISYHPCMDFSFDDTTNVKIPASVRFEHGIGVDVRKNSSSPYSFQQFEDGIFIVKDGERLTKISTKHNCKIKPGFMKPVDVKQSMKSIACKA